MTAPAQDTTIVVGAGIIGAAIALELRERGRDVILLDPAEPGRGASFGNMASIAISEFMPVSRPSIWRQVPGWLVDPEGPIRIRPGYTPKLVPWFWRFLRAGLPGARKVSEDAGAALCARVFDDLEPLLRRLGRPDILSERGCLAIYSGDAEFAADREHREVLEHYEIPHRAIDAAELREIEPALAPVIDRAILLTASRTIADPFGLVQLIVDRFRSLGGRFVSGEIERVCVEGGRVAAVAMPDGTRLLAAEVVIAAGARTGLIARTAGDFIPLETERGYHTQLPDPGIALNHALIYPARAFMVSPTAGGIRIGGTIELAGLDAAPDYRRSKVTARAAARVLPDLSFDGSTEWMGHRPALPDTIPVIGQSPRAPNLYYATGHGHLGLTLAATTARLIADLATDRPPAIDLHPYRASRF